VSLRSATADNVVIVDMTKGKNAVIGEMDRPSAKELLFPNAVYIHLGRQYIVTSLDIPNRRAEVEESEVNYFTDAVVKTDIKVLSEDENVPNAPIGTTVIVGDLLVRTQVAKFKKLKFHTHENIGFGEIALDAEERETRGMMLLLDGISDGGKALEDFDRLDEASRAEVLAGIGSIIKSVAPFFCYATEGTSVSRPASATLISAVPCFTCTTRPRAAQAFRSLSRPACGRFSRSPASAWLPANAMTAALPASASCNPGLASRARH
jgi:ATP-dependent helicase YprA (DUF1998 family)